MSMQILPANGLETSLKTAENEIEFRALTARKIGYRVEGLM
jgi:hypothetical protein